MTNLRGNRWNSFLRRSMSFDLITIKALKKSPSDSPTAISELFGSLLKTKTETSATMAPGKPLTSKEKVSLRESSNAASCKGSGADSTPKPKVAYSQHNRSTCFRGHTSRSRISKMESSMGYGRSTINSAARSLRLPTSKVLETELRRGGIPTGQKCARRRSKTDSWTE